MQSTFDEIYAKVPSDQVAWLKEFRLAHPYKRLAIGDTEWEYTACGRGEQALLLLPGALSVGESTFPLINAFKNEYRIIAPSYALSLTMTGLCDGIARILEMEGLNQAHVLGGSYGGLVAQYFVRRHPRLVRSLILSHTFVLTPTYQMPLRIVGKLFHALPRSLFEQLLRLRLNKMLLSTLRACRHPEFEFWRAYLNEAIASNRLKDVVIHQNACLLDLAQQPRFTEHDLKDWRGRILIIESNDDPAIPAKARELLKATYPQAQVHTFEDAGHASSILKREEVSSLIRNFLTADRFKATFGDIVRVVCKYPEMYLMNGTFGESLAFLDGYAYGRELGAAGRSSSFFHPFKDWLCHRFGWKETEDFWRAFRDKYGDEQTALTEFARLWTEYEVESNSVDEKSVLK